VDVGKGRLATGTPLNGAALTALRCFRLSAEVATVDPMEQGRVRGGDAPAESTGAIRFPPFRVEPASERLWREHEPIALKPKAFAILLYLLKNPSRIVTKAELLAQLWGGVHVNDAVLKTHLREIRRALGDDVRAPRYIETAHRRGYRFIAPSSLAPPESAAADASVMPRSASVATASAATASAATASAATASAATASVVGVAMTSDSLRPPAPSAPPSPVAVSTMAQSHLLRADAPTTDPPQPVEPGLRSGFTSAQPYFVGRHAELEWLEGALAAAYGGQRQIALVNGPAGIGKTSLVRVLASRLPSGGAAVAWGQCVEQCGADEAYLPLIEALSRLGRGPDRARWVEHLRRYAPSWVARLPIFQAATPGVAGLGSVTSGVAASEHLLYQLTDALETFTHQGPLLLVLEDIQWADPSTLSWLTYMAHRADPARLFVVCTFRPLEISRGAHPLAALKRALERQSSRSELKLPCLGPADVAAYVAARFPDATTQAEVVELLHARTAGNPLFMVRVLDSWLERGLLSRRSGAPPPARNSHMAPAAPSSAAPSSPAPSSAAESQGGEWYVTCDRAALERETPDCVVSLIEQEYEQLTEFECSVIEAASVAGPEFSVASVAAALSAELLVVEDLCVRWAKQGQFFQIVGRESWPDGTLATRLGFVHALYRETAYARLGAARQTLLHLGIGRWQEQAYGERSVEIAPELAFHFEQARDYRRAALHLCSAGERAVATRAYADAGEHFRKGVALIEHLPHGLQRARLEIRLQVGVAALLTASRANEAEKARAAHTAAGIGKQFLDAAHARQDESAALRATLLLGMAEACLGELEAARSRLQQAIAQHDMARQDIARQGAAREDAARHVHTREAPAQVPAPRALPGRPVPALPAIGGAVVFSAQLAHPQAAVLELAWRSMLRSFLGESAANDGEATPASIVLDGGEMITPVPPSVSSVEGFEAPVAVEWVERLLRQALTEIDTWFANASFANASFAGSSFADAPFAQNDLDEHEPRHGYRFERRVAEGARRASPAIPRD
jgi:DNA-binding winged helix-turn-helix (wHTH) protein